MFFKRAGDFMLKTIELENIRLFENNRFKFELAPFTIFCGTNSSGKSTILKTLLMLSQCQENADTFRNLPGRLNLSGPKVDLGSYSTFISRRDMTKDIQIVMTVSNEMPFQRYRDLVRAKNLKFKRENTSERKSITYSLECNFIFAPEERIKSLANISSISSAKGVKKESQPLPSQGILKLSTYKIKVNNSVISSWKVNLVNYDKNNGVATYKIRIPKTEYLNGSRRSSDKNLERFKKTVVGEVDLYGLLPANVLIKQKGMTKRNPLRLSLPTHIQSALSDLNIDLTGISYLGPLRTPAERYYITASEGNPYNDISGKFLPYILSELVNEPANVPDVTHCIPGKRKSISEPLTLALNRWLRYLRSGDFPNEGEIQDEIEASTMKGILVELAIKSMGGDNSYALADSGFGYSQILPIIVRGLVLSPGYTLVIEQPELHLNPSLQVRLAEFFASMVRAGKQVFIETHSEHIVNTIRVLVAEKAFGDISSKCEIFFLDNVDGKPIIHTLSVKPDGTVPEWPYNFFGEAANLTGRLLRAQSKLATRMIPPVRHTKNKGNK